MALEKRISELTAKSGIIEDTDLLVISDYNGTTYDTKKITGAQLNQYKLYISNISQSGTSDPSVVTSFTQGLISSISWAYISTGTYEATLSSAELILNQTFLSISLGNGVLGYYSIIRVSTTKFRVLTYNTSGTLTNGMLLDTMIEIKIIK